MEKSKKVLLEVCGVLVFVAVICVVIVHNRTSVAAVLEENYHNGTYSGVDGYIAASTIQDITGLNLYECTEIDWSTAEEFFEQWDATIQNLPDTFEKIVNSDLSD